MRFHEGFRKNLEEIHHLVSGSLVMMVIVIVIVVGVGSISGIHRRHC